MQVRRALLLAALVSSAMSARIVAAAPRDAKLLLGRWKAVALEAEGKRTPAPPGVVLTTEFLDGGTFVGTETQQGKKTVRKAGTWRVVGNLLTTVVAQKTRTYAYSVQGKQLRLTKEGKPVQHMILERLER